MRVTNSMLVSNFMNNLNTNMTKLDKLQNQMASGKKYAHISDNPIAVIYSREARYKLNRLEQYSANVSKAQEWLMQVESSVKELNEVIKNAYESCIDASTGVKNPDDRANASEYIGQMRDHILSTLNAAYGDKYVFGGYNTSGSSPESSSDGPFTLEYEDDDNDPLTPDITHLLYNGKRVSDINRPNPPDPTDPDNFANDVLSFDVGPAITMPVTINGYDIVSLTLSDGTQTNLFKLLDDLYNVAQDKTKSADDINAYILPLQEAQDHLLGKLAELGGRTNRLDLLTSRYEQDYINYTQMLSNAEDADMSEVIMHQKMAEAVYNAALASGAQIIQPTLMDFLR